MPLRVPIDDLRRFVIEALRPTGMNAEDASIVADALLTADAMGVFTHGTKLLPGYVNRLNGGGYRATGKPRVTADGPAWAVIDGDAALGQIGCVFAMRTAIEKARQVGIAYVGLTNTGHIGAAGYYALMATREGMIGLVTGNDTPSVAAPGSRGPVLGSNPIAYGIPVGDSDPILLDMATAAVAGGKVYAAHTRGEPIPPTWLIGPDGKPTTDGSLYPHQASLAPMAGHKGYGFGLWCEVLSAILPGGRMTWEVGSWMFDDPAKASGHNASFVAIDIAAIDTRKQFETRLRKLIDEIHAAPCADGVELVLLPGEKEGIARRQALAEGIDLPSDVREKLRSLISGDDTPEWLRP